MTEAVLRCPHCNGSGLSITQFGEVDDCRECHGNTVVTVARMRQERRWRRYFDSLAEMLKEAQDNEHEQF